MDGSEVPEDPPGPQDRESGAGDVPAWVLDEDFIAGASVREPSAAERRVRAEADWRERELQARLAAQREDEEAERSALRRRRWLRRTAVFTIAAMAVGLAGWLASAVGTNRSDGAAGTAPSSDLLHSSSADQLGAPLGGSATAPDAAPTPTLAESDTPLGTPARLPKGSGKYEFLAMRSDDADRPVAYDPCRPIRIAINAEQAPPGGEALVAQALRRMAEVTGLVFVVEEPTTERAAERRSPFQPDRYGDRWAPVLVWWADSKLAPTLKGSVAGFGGSSWYRRSAAAAQGLEVPETFVSGAVVLDGPQLREIMEFGRAGRAQARAVILHELGHLVGLDHVDDPTQLMNPEATAEVTDFGAGDLRGLHDLGSGTCSPLL